MPSDKIQRQIDSKIIEGRDGNYGVCIDADSDWKDWLLQKHADGGWVTLRKALPSEISAAKTQYNLLLVIVPTDRCPSHESEQGGEV